MALIKRGGQLFEDTDDTLMSRVNKLGTSTPTSPKGADGIGVSPDSAKMMGAGAQRQKALRDAVAPKEATLAGQQRLKGPAEATDVHKQAQERAQQLQQLGAMGTRVQSLIEQRIATAGTDMTAAGTVADIQASMEGINRMLGFSPEQIAADQAADGPNVAGQFKELIDRYMNAPNTGENAEELLAQMVALHPNIEKHHIYQMTGLTETGEEATGRMIADAMAPTLTLADLDLTELGFADLDQVADALGVDDVTNMTVPEFQDALEKLQGAEFDRIEEIKAELARLPQGSARRQMLMEEAAALGDVGIMSAEAMVEEAAQEIDTAHEVEIAGQTYTIEEILSDETISELIEDYMLADDETKEDIFPEETFGALREWITGNQVALNTLIESAVDTRDDFRVANERWEDMENSLGLSTEMMESIGWNPEATMTSENLGAWIKDNNLGGSLGFGSMYTMNEDGELELKEGVSEKTASDVTADNKDIIAGMSSEEIQESNEYNDKIETSSVLASLTGIDDISNNFLSAAQVSRAKQWEEIARTIESTTLIDAWNDNEALRTAVKNGKVGAEWLDPKYSTALADPLAVEMITSGALDIKDIDLLNDENWGKARTAYRDVQAKNQQIQNAKSLDDMLDIVFGMPVSESEMQRYLSEMKFANEFAGVDNQTDIDRYTNLLDADKLKQMALSGSSLIDFLKGEGQQWKPDPADGNVNGKQYISYDQGATITSRLWDMYKDDQKIDVDEIMNSPQSAEVYAQLKASGKLPAGYDRQAGAAYIDKYLKQGSEALRNVNFTKVSDPEAERDKLFKEAQDWFDRAVQEAKDKHGGKVPDGVYHHIRDGLRRKKERINHEVIDNKRYQTATKDYNNILKNFKAVPDVLRKAALGRMYALRNITTGYRTSNKSYDPNYNKDIKSLANDPAVIEATMKAMPLNWGDTRTRAQRLADAKAYIQKFIGNF